MAEKAMANESAQPAPDGQLPLWPEPQRAVPNGVLRSALFGATARGPRRFLDREQLAALEGDSYS